MQAALSLSAIPQTCIRMRAYVFPLLALACAVAVDAAAQTVLAQRIDSILSVREEKAKAKYLADIQTILSFGEKFHKYKYRLWLYRSQTVC